MHSQHRQQNHTGRRQHKRKIFTVIISISILIGGKEKKKKKENFNPKPMCSAHDSKLPEALCYISGFPLATESQHTHRHYGGASPVKTRGKQSSYPTCFTQLTFPITWLHHCSFSLSPFPFLPHARGTRELASIPFPPTSFQRPGETRGPSRGNCFFVGYFAVWTTVF